MTTRVATYRALGVKIKPPGGEEATARRCRRWSGRATRSASRRSRGASRTGSRSTTSLVLAGPAPGVDALPPQRRGGLGRRGDRLPEPEKWLPGRHPRFDELVDHLCQQLLHRDSTKRLLKACCVAVDVQPYEPIDEDHALVQWKFPRLLTTLLDSPEHLSR